MLTAEDKLERFIKKNIEELYTFVPGYFTHIYKNTCTANAKMSIPMRSKVTGVVNGIVELRDVPIQFPMGESFKVTYPVKKGDHCLLMFSQSELTEWKKSKEPLTDLRGCLRYDINNAIAIPGGYSPLNCKIKYPSGLDDENICIDGTVKLDGKMTIGKVNTSAVARADITIQIFDILIPALKAFANAKDITTLLAGIGVLSTALTALDFIKTDSIKSSNLHSE